MHHKEVMKNMFTNERSLTRWLIKTIKVSNLYSVKGLLSGDAIPKKPYGDILVNYFGSYAPMIIARPDIVLVVEDYRKLLDEWLLIAVELKYFKKIEKKRWREAYREVGQALRYYVYGFDSAVLWHIFDKGIDDDVVKAYSNVVGEVIERLKLPIAYFSTKMVDADKFLVFKLLELSGSSDVSYVVRWIISYCRDSVRNPLLPHDKEIVERRKALKAVLRIP